MSMTNARSLAGLLQQRVAETPDRDAFLFPANDSWQRYTWKDTGDRVRAIACGLRALGVSLEERCAIFCSTRIEWVLIDFGIMCAGGATTTIYPSNTVEECAFILTDSRSGVAFVENEPQLANLDSAAAAADRTPRGRRLMEARGGRRWATTLDDLMARAAPGTPRIPGRSTSASSRSRPDIWRRCSTRQARRAGRRASS